MLPETLAFVQSFPGFTTDEAKQIAEALVVRSYPKGTLLLREGDAGDECFFVLKGFLRQYRIVDGLEKTTGFFVEHEAAVLYASYGNEAATQSFLECGEDTVVIIGNVQQEQSMYEQHPKLAKLTRSMVEDDFGKVQEQRDRFLISTPEQRYEYLLNNRLDLVQRVPQHQLASYIGVAPESLSRIRKRLASKERSVTDKQ